MHDTYTAHRDLLHLITLIVFGVQSLFWKKKMLIDKTLLTYSLGNVLYFPLRHPSEVQIFSLKPCSQTP
jgi:hypothetical protein